MDIKQCALSLCGKTINPTTESYANIRLNVDKLSKAAKECKAVQFDPASGVAIMHTACLDKLVNPKRGQSIEMPQALYRKLVDAETRAEFFDSREELVRKSKLIAQLIQSANQPLTTNASSTESKGAVIFTGAGISTAAGVGDFRGIFGQWTIRDHGFQDDGGGCDYESLRPTLTHEAIHEMEDSSLVRYVVSQNCDGLHLLSGVKSENLSELHGNVYIEKCLKCGKSYVRPFYVCNDDADNSDEDDDDDDDVIVIDDDDGDNGSKKRKTSKKKSSKKPKKSKLPKCKTCGLNHYTIRKCDDCNEFLYDTIINFGDDLDEQALSKAIDHSKHCRVLFVLGSTLTVTPASSLAELEPHQKLLICNRQRTEKDAEAAVRIFGDCDDVMAVVMSELLGQAKCDKWVKDRTKRLKKYASARKPE